MSVMFASGHGGGDVASERYLTKLRCVVVSL